METSEQIIRIEEKIQQLLKEYEAVQKEVVRLEKENKSLTEELQQKTVLANNLQQKIDAIQIYSSNNGLSEQGKKEIEKRIDVYLKEIEKCMALLNS